MPPGANPPDCAMLKPILRGAACADATAGADAAMTARPAVNSLRFNMMFLP